MNNETQKIVLANTNGKVTAMLEKEKGALPPGFNTLRFKQNVLTVLSEMDLENMKGKEFNLARCIMKGAYLGLDFFNKECYAITFDGTPKFMTDYKGEEKLCKKYSISPIQDIYAKLVKEGDEFEEGVKEGKQYVNFKSKPFSNAKVIGAFAVAYFKDGSMLYETMSTEEVEYVRDVWSKKSKKTGQFSDAWVKSFGEMAKKTILRRLCKHIQLDFDNIEQQKAWEDGSDMEFTNTLEPSKEAEKSDLEKELEKNGEVETDKNIFVDTPFEEVNENENNQG
ncbi:recombinase RecT [Clostridium saccharoperbutylacetonicum]|uniref:recombinase RecT n=1 Tax=Clostridium saccharoperbutylacetonicum TaxID=36745 RepID=UPI0039EC5C4B